MNYSALKQEIADLAIKAGRDPAEIALVAVSKGISWHRMEQAYSQGCRLFGENRLPELDGKIQEAPSDIQWHWIGHLQKNKVSKVIASCSLIHSVDSLDLACKISTLSSERPTRILFEVNASGEATKQGFAPAELQKLFPELQALPNLQIEGLMTMAPFTKDPLPIRKTFATLRQLRDKLATPDNPLPHLSMGMSNDYPIAIEEGATLLRIGTALW